MQNWKNRFLEHRLKQGKTLYVENHVVNYQEDAGKYTATISGNQIFDVRITTADGKIKRMSCGCPVAKMGNSCEHMAAVLYASEARKIAEETMRTEEAIRLKWKAEEQPEETAKKKTPEKRTKRDEAAARRKQQEAEAEKQRVIEAARKAYLEEEKAKALLRAEQEKEKARLKEEQEKEKARLKAEQEKEKARLKEEAKKEKARLKAEEQEKARKLAEEQKRAEEERERKRLEREKRKQEKAAKDAENKRRIAEAREAEAAKRKAEEERREKIREQKAQEAQRKAEKKRQEEEAARAAAIRREEEARKRAEEERKELEKLLKEEQKRREEERKENERKMQEMKAAQKREEERLRFMQAKEKERSENYVLLGDSWDNEQEEKQTGISIKDLSEYRYFDAAKIRNSVRISEAQSKKGRELLKSKRLEIEDISNGYFPEIEEAVGQIEASGKYRTEQFDIRVTFTKDKIYGMRCNCPNCRDWYFSYDTGSMCDYKAGVIDYLTDYLKNHNIGDATKQSARSFLEKFRGKRMIHTEKQKDTDTQAPQKLLPRLLKKDGQLTLSFKFGESKMYVVKDLEKFCEQVSKGEEGTYGSGNTMIHDLERFEESGRKWFRFLKQIVQEEQMVNEKVRNSGYYYNRSSVSIGNSVELFGWRMDSVFERLKESAVEYEDWDQEPKWKTMLRAGELKPKLNLIISPNPNKKGTVFHGIHVSANIPSFFEGTDTSYYLEGNTLSKVDTDFNRKIEPLKNSAKDGKLSLDIGRNTLSEFYYHVLPELKEIASVTELNADRIRSYLLPEARYFFYLDADSYGIHAEADVHYGEEIYNLLDYMDEEKHLEIDDYRDLAGEQDALDVLLKYLNCYDEQEHMLHNNGGEEEAYLLYTKGIEELNTIGEVHCTKNFMDRRKLKKVSVSVGVKVSEGMLNLEILTQDLTDKELLDILKSYRSKKKYYRLKDGSFVNLEDPALEILTEMTDVLHLTKEELKKKSIALPMYRALYLDRLLAENEELYEDRDNVIRRMTSQFQTIENTEFDVPKSLKKIMRSYQKDGFKWLKTLENWGFGGILADEMGLGKTLQTISVLLSAREEGKEGTSLIVCPASLVYNWEEELHRFAPQLRVQTVTGTQAERNEIVSEMDADVLVTSYDLLKRDIACYDGKEFLFEVIDEAQYIKNHVTAAAKSVKAIKSKIRYALTGTPVENRLSELWSIFDYLMPGFLYGYETFRKEYELPIVKNEDEEAMKRLQRMTGPFILRRRKEDVLKDLPEKLEEVRYVKMEEKQQHLYDGQLIEIKNVINKQTDQEFSQSKIQILAALTKLRQLCCDPSLCIENYKGETAKTDACLELIQGAIDGGHRMLVFSQFTSMLDILKERLEKAGISYFLLTGSTSKEERAELVQQFNESDVPVFLISLKAGGVGLNLTGADMVIHYDPWWNSAAQSQATDRAHRIGQKKKVTVYKMITKGTIEEKILQLQEKKKALADQILSGEGGQLGSLSREEILEILENR